MLVHTDIASKGRESDGEEANHENPIAGRSCGPAITSPLLAIAPASADTWGPVMLNAYRAEQPGCSSSRVADNFDIWGTEIYYDEDPYDAGYWLDPRYWLDYY